jgi:hypothetical protein
MARREIGRVEREDPSESSPSLSEIAKLADLAAALVAPGK